MESGRAEEEERVQRARQGDAAAFAELVRLHQAPLYRVCAALLGPQEAEDATQEAFVRVHQGLAKFDARARFGTWAYRIATNVSLNRLRARRRLPRPQGLEALSAIPSREAGPLARSQGSELWSAIQSALADLSPEQRAVVVLRGVEGLPFEEVSRVLQIPLPTAQSRFSRARKRLRSKLASFLPEEDS